MTGAPVTMALPRYLAEAQPSPTLHHPPPFRQPSTFTDWPAPMTPITGYCVPGPARTLRSVVAAAIMSAIAGAAVIASAAAESITSFLIAALLFVAGYGLANGAQSAWFQHFSPEA